MFKYVFLPKYIEYIELTFTAIIYSAGAIVHYILSTLNWLLSL